MSRVLPSIPPIISSSVPSGWEGVPLYSDSKVSEDSDSPSLRDVSIPLDSISFSTNEKHPLKPSDILRELRKEHFKPSENIPALQALVLDPELEHLERAFVVRALVEAKQNYWLADVLRRRPAPSQVISQMAHELAWSTDTYLATSAREARAFISYQQIEERKPLEQRETEYLEYLRKGLERSHKHLDHTAEHALSQFREGTAPARQEKIVQLIVPYLSDRRLALSNREVLLERVLISGGTDAIHNVIEDIQASRYEPEMDDFATRQLFSKGLIVLIEIDKIPTPVPKLLELRKSIHAVRQSGADARAIDSLQTVAPLQNGITINNVPVNTSAATSYARQVALSTGVSIPGDGFNALVGHFQQIVPFDLAGREYLVSEAANALSDLLVQYPGKERIMTVGPALMSHPRDLVLGSANPQLRTWWLRSGLEMSMEQLLAAVIYHELFHVTGYVEEFSKKGQPSDQVGLGLSLHTGPDSDRRERLHMLEEGLADVATRNFLVERYQAKRIRHGHVLFDYSQTSPEIVRGIQEIRSRLEPWDKNMRKNMVYPISTETLSVDDQVLHIGYGPEVAAITKIGMDVENSFPRPSRGSSQNLFENSLYHAHFTGDRKPMAALIRKTYGSEGLAFLQTVRHYNRATEKNGLDLVCLGMYLHAGYLDGMPGQTQNMQIIRRDIHDLLKAIQQGGQ